MEFVKVDTPAGNETRIVHCKYCDCGDSEKASLNKDTSKATGG